MSHNGTDVDTVSFDSHGTRCSAWYLQAASDELTTARGRPCVVMGHGFGATRDCGLFPFAEQFARAGSDVLLFDYRGFGSSDGTPRQDVDYRLHRQDYHAAVAAARALPGVDAGRVVVWGSSYSGGHVIAVAAQDPTIGAVISQAPVMDGLATMSATRRSAGAKMMATLTAAGLRDLVRALTGRAPYLIPAVGAPGSVAVISASGAEAGNAAVIGPSYRNEVCARVVLRTALNRPVLSAKKVRCPTLLVVAEQDNVAPATAVHEVAKRIGPNAEVVSYPCGHFDVYVGEVFNNSVKAQVEFLRRVLAAEPSIGDCP
jgi:uncharacterized protein